MKYLLIILLFLAPSVAQAHFLERDGTIGAVLHIEPGDAPVAGQSATLFFDLKDTKGKFQLANCQCQIILSSDGRVVSQQPLTDNAATPYVSYTFPAAGIYQVELSGFPYVAGDFSKFDLKWQTRVERGITTSSSNKGGFLLWTLLGAIFVAIVGYVAWSRYEPRKPRSRH
ncbi:MAG: hypothetical protein WCO52_04090 [bacterium]